MGAGAGAGTGGSYCDWLQFSNPQIPDSRFQNIENIMYMYPVSIIPEPAIRTVTVDNLRNLLM